jgi:hypothetical protein
MENGIQRAIEAVQGVAQMLNRGIQIGKQVAAYNELVSKMSFRDAGEELLGLLDGVPSEHWQAFKREFLTYTLTIISPEKRLRATELYALMNILEFQYYKRAPEFVTDGRALS